MKTSLRTWIIYVLLCCTFANTYILSILNRTEDQQELIYQCTIKVIKLNLNEYGHLSVFASSTDLDLLHKLFAEVNASVLFMTSSTNNSLMSIQRYKDTALIALSPDGPDLADVLQHHLKDWRSSIVIMIPKTLTDDDLRNITKMLAHSEKVNVAILAHLTPEKIGVFGFTPFHKNCTEWDPYLIDSCTSSGFDSGGKIFPRNKTFNLNGCNQATCSMPNPPFVVFSKSSSGELSLKRFGGWLMHIFASHLNFTYKVHTPKEQYWGSVFSNGSATGCFGNLMSKSADIVMGDLLIIPHRYQYTDFIRTISGFCITWAVPAANHFDQSVLKTLLSGFTIDLWMMLFTAFFMCLSALTMANVSFDKATLYLFGAMIDAPTGNIPARAGPRSIALAWLFFCVVMNNVYRSKLFTVLSFPKKLDINTLEQVAESGFKIITVAAVRETLISLGKEIMNPTTISLGNRSVIVSDMSRGFRELVKGQKSILLLSETVLSYFMKENKVYDQPGGVHKSTPCFFHYPNTQFFFRKGSPLVGAFDRTVLRLNEAGIVQHMFNLEFPKKGQTELTLKSLSLSKIKSVFFILYTGYSLALVVFLAEWGFMRYKTKTHTRKRD